MLYAVNMRAIDAIFPKGRAEVLRNLFNEEDSELHMRELVRRTGLNLRTVQRELAQLTDSEIITSRRDGNRQYFKANKGNPIYQELRCIVIKDCCMAEVLREALKDVAGIQVAFIYGSVAKRTEKASSDIDLFVIGEAGLRDIVPVLGPASEKLHREINAYNITPETWEAKLASGDAFINSVAQEAKIFVKGLADDLE
jgi:DNA-binding transcriptional ArsR family regulator